MKFTPMTQLEIDSLDLLPEGIYNFEVLEASEEVSKKGHHQMKLKIKIISDKSQRIVYDYIGNSSFSISMRKLHDICFHCGLKDKYELGEIWAQDLIYKRGKALVTIQAAKDGYPAKNQIAEYLSSNSQTGENVKSQEANQENNVPFDDDLPF